MATTVDVPRRTQFESENIVDFVPEEIFAPFILRCAGLFIDYLVLLAFPVAWLVLGKFVTDTGAVTMGSYVWGVGVVIFVLDCLALPMLFGKSIGKLLTGMTIVNNDGTAVGVVGILRRNVLGYAITSLTLGVGFLSAAFSTKGRALHDIVGGTVVIRGRKTRI